MRIFPICSYTRWAVHYRSKTFIKQEWCYRGPNTDTIGISETINPTKECLMNNIFIII